MPEVANASSINGLACSPQGAGFGLCVPNGYDTAISLPASVLGSGSQPEFQLQRRVSSGSAGQMWTSTLCVSARAGAQKTLATLLPLPPCRSAPLRIPAACAGAAAAPVCNKPSGSSTTNAFMWVQISSATPGGFLYVTTDGSNPRTSATATFVQVREGRHMWITGDGLV